MGLPGWFRHAYFEYHSHVRLRFSLAAGLGRPWTRDGGVPQGCPLCMMFIVASLKCVSRDPAALLRAARFTVGCVRLVDQEPAPKKCVPPSTSRVVRNDMRGWIVTPGGSVVC